MTSSTPQRRKPPWPAATGAKKRGLSDAAIRRFGLGYAPEDFVGLLHYLRHRGFTEPELESSGLVKRSAKGNLYDIFRHRVMVPIIDVRGNIIAFGGRVMDDSKPKYINSPETMVYHKSRTLFALNVAKKSTSKRYILCEGYMDVISMHEAGFDTAVCACGTALTPEQVKLLTEYADEVVLSYDSDEAGQKATERSLALFSGTNLQVRVLNIPGAKDPDEFIRTYGRDRFEAVLEGTATPLEFKLAKAVKKYDLRNDAQRLQYVDEAIGILAGSAVSPTARDVYAGRIAEQTGIDKKAVLVQLESAVRGAGRRARRKEQNELSRQGIAADIRVPYDRGGRSCPGGRKRRPPACGGYAAGCRRHPLHPGAAEPWHGGAAGNAAGNQGDLRLRRPRPACQRHDPFPLVGGKSLQPGDAGPGPKRRYPPDPPGY